MLKTHPATSHTTNSIFGAYLPPIEDLGLELHTQAHKSALSILLLL